jgi:general secretion pathway protein G
LIEILVVLAIMALIAGAVGVASYRFFKESQVKTATIGARTIRGAVKSWWVTTGSNGCPTLADLMQNRVLDEGSPRKDPWGKPWRIECSEDEVSVGSDGPDGASGTADDVRVPPLNRNGIAAPEDSS